MDYKAYEPKVPTPTLNQTAQKSIVTYTPGPAKGATTAAPLLHCGGKRNGI